MDKVRALVVAVGTFRSAVAAEEEPPIGVEAWDPLDFVYKVLPEVQQALEDLGYAVDVVRDPVLAELRAVTADALDGGHRVMHLMSHGVAGRGHDPNRLDLVASDSRTGAGSNIADWVSTAQASGKPTLFLLDLCRSGVAARLPFMVQLAGRDTHAWVIAASGGTEDAFDGRFSQAAAEILEESSLTGLGTDPTQRYVSFSLLARRIGERLSRMPGLPQTIHATPLDPSQPEPELPFVPNPAFVWDPSLAARRAVEGPLRPFVDEPTVLRPQDSAHFADKVGRHFTGRRSQLALLAPWLDGDGTANLCLVTGQPGTGKSALIGAVVGAAHPTLVEAAPHIRARLETDPAGCPSINPGLAAAHARQREVDDLITSLARQLRLDVPDDGWSPNALVEAVIASDEAPTVVLDALDEATEPARVMHELLLPLARSRRPDGEAGCRLLIGARPWDEFTALRRATADGGLLIDLDVADPAELHRDLADYLSIALTKVDGYASGKDRHTRERVAITVADSLIEAPDQQWGSFLVASVFVRYLAAVPVPGSGPEAERLAWTVPHHLHAVFELDLRARPNSAAARALLTAFAFAKGDGMPTELAFPLAATLAPGVTDAELQDTLADVLFYLRTDVEQDGTTLYRPFHQGLADYLTTQRADSSTTGPVASLVLDALLACAGERRGGALAAWATAQPYLLRHAIQHARDCDRQDELFTDADFLVYADPVSLIPALATAETSAARLAVAVYRASSGIHRHADVQARRQLLVIDAARYRDRVMLGQLNDVAPPGTWRPRWATGSQVDSSLLDTFTGHVDTVTAVACTELAEGPIAVTAGDDGTIRLWDLISRQPLRTLRDGHGASITAVVCLTVSGRPYAVASDQEDRLQLWDLAAGTPADTPYSTDQGRILALSTVETDKGPIIVAAGEVGLAFYELRHRSDGLRFSKVFDHDLACTAVACMRLDDRPVAVVTTRGSGIQIWDIDTRLINGDPFGERLSAATAVACTRIGDRPVAVVATRHSGIWLWDLANRKVVGAPFADALSAATSVSCVVLGGQRPIAVTTSDDGTVRRWDLNTRRPIGNDFVGHTDWVRAVTVTTIPETASDSTADDQLVAISVSDDATVRLWDMTPRRPVGRPVTGHRGSVHAVATTVDGTSAIVLTAAEDDFMRLWGLEHGDARGFLNGAQARALVSIRLKDRPGGMDRPVAVASGASGTMSCWNLATQRPMGRFNMRHDRGTTGLASVLLNDRPMLLSCNRRGDVRMWDLGQRTPTSPPVPGHLGAATGVASLELGGEPHAVTCGDDGTVRLWKLKGGFPSFVAVLRGHTAGVTAVACTELGSLPVAVSTGYDRTVRVWDLLHRRQLGDPLQGHDGGVLAVTCMALGGRPVAVTSGEDSTVRLWDLRQRTADIVTLPMPAKALAIAPDGSLVIGCGSEVIVVERQEPS